MRKINQKTWQNRWIFIHIPLLFNLAIAASAKAQIAPEVIEIAQESSLTSIDSLPPLAGESLGNYTDIQTETNFLPVSDLNSSEISPSLAQSTGNSPGLIPYNRVDSLRDVSPDHWAYEAIKQLIRNFGCIEGDENDNFRGDRTLTRYEFAAALDICLRRTEAKLDALSEYVLATQDELATMQRLREEFATELADLEAQVDSLEERTTFLEDNNFSTTTILRGQVDVILSSVFGDRRAVPSGQSPTEDLDSVVTLGSRVRLNLDTSFTGKDLLRTRLEAGNINGLGSGVTGTAMTTIDAAINIDNNVRLGKLFYRFPVGDRGLVYLGAARQSSSDFIPLVNPAATISLFGFYNPIYDVGFGAGAGAYYQISDAIGAGFTYYAGSNSSPEDSRGLFNGDFGALAQVTLTPSDRLGVTLTYLRFYSPQPGATNNVTSFVGSQFAQLPFGGDTATSADGFNIATAYQIGDRFQIGGWVGYTRAEAESSPFVNGLNGNAGSNADIWTWAVTASIYDVGKLGSNLNFIFGMPPRARGNDIADRNDRDTSFHIEMSYNYSLANRITVIPAFVLITNPEHNSENDDIWVGLLRTRIDF